MQAFLFGLVWTLHYFILLIFCLDTVLHLWFIYVAHPTLPLDISLVDICCSIFSYKLCFLFGLAIITLQYLFIIFCFANIGFWLGIRHYCRIVLPRLATINGVWSLFMIYLLHFLLAYSAVCITWWLVTYFI